MKSAQDYLKETASGETRGGFNSRIQGNTNRECMNGMPHGSRWGQRNNGWDIADKMIKEGKIYSKIYSNKLGQKIEFKCMPDGNMWCCVGANFIDLQESDNYEFGDSWADAINKFLSRE